MTVHVIGNAMRDIVYRTDRLPTPGETRTAHAKTEDFGGKGLNQAVAAARAGADVRFAFAVGSDDSADALLAILSSEERIVVRAWRRAGPTDESIIAVAHDGENFILSTLACASSVRADEAVDAIQSARRGDVVVFQGNLSEHATAAGLRAAHEAGCVTLLNPAPFHFDVTGMLPFVTILVVNEGEAREVGRPEAAVRSLGKGGALIVTLGARGCVIHRAGQGEEGEELVAAERVRAVDTTGAGDAFVGTLAAGLSLSVPLSAAVRGATSAAADAVTRAGTYRAIAALPATDWGALAALRPVP